MVKMILLVTIVSFATNLQSASCFSIFSHSKRNLFYRNDSPVQKRFPRLNLLDSIQTSDALDEITDSETTAYLTFQHPNYNIEITLIGCLHGSSSSANDVSYVLNQSHTDAVVLELCPTRYKDLMSEVDRRKKDDELKSSMDTPNYFMMVKKTIEARGFATGIAAAVLGSASGISTALSGFEPGLEFVTAIDYVNIKAKKLSSGNIADVNERVDIILADRIVDETLQRIGSLPSIATDMLKLYIENGFNWASVYGCQSEVLNNAIAGDKSNGEYLDLGKALFRNKQVIQDLIRITLPSLALVLIVNSALILSLDGSITSSIATFDIHKYGLKDAMVDISTIFILILGYMMVALPTVKVVLTERDEQLTKGINDACRIISEKYESEGDLESLKNRQGRVVAVLGFLHVNGVKKLLMQ